METVGVIGGGAFASALADLAGSRGPRVLQWFPSAEDASRFNATRENGGFLPGFRLSDNIRATGDLAEVAGAARLVFLCLPSAEFREAARRLGDGIEGDHLLVSTTKGIEAGSFKLMTEILREETCCLRIGVLSGPNLAKEIAGRVPSGTVIASRYEEVVERVQAALSGPHFRVYSNSDVYGVELGGALTSMYAIAAGLMAALRMGGNAVGMLVTRGLAEMGRYAERLGSDPLTCLGLSGVGDLVTTCTSPLSRNFRVGYLIGQGRTLDQALKEIGDVAEGVNMVRIVKERIGPLGIQMHIVEGLHSLLFGGTDVPTVVQQLMSVPQMKDVEFQSRPARISD
jgi:glycerol-3-phosphate dehydrogenase (NAD(P)+)